MTLAFSLIDAKVYSTSVVLSRSAGGSDAAVIPLAPVRLRFGAALQ